jgi:hypothetical protein
MFAYTKEELKIIKKDNIIISDIIKYLHEEYGARVSDNYGWLIKRDFENILGYSTETGSRIRFRRNITISKIKGYVSDTKRQMILINEKSIIKILKHINKKKSYELCVVFNIDISDKPPLSIPEGFDNCPGFDRKRHLVLLSDFNTSNNTKSGFQNYCKLCMIKYSKKHYNDNKEDYKNYQSNRYINNKERILEVNNRWAMNNKDKRTEHCARRRARKLNATPSWLTIEQLNEIKEFYSQSKKIELITGVLHHVDHIVPLQGENVCGLHVPWNLQVITATENISKNNKLIVEDILSPNNKED